MYSVRVSWLVDRPTVARAGRTVSGVPQGVQGGDMASVWRRSRGDSRRGDSLADAVCVASASVGLPDMRCV